MYYAFISLNKSKEIVMKIKVNLNLRYGAINFKSVY